MSAQTALELDRVTRLEVGRVYVAIGPAEGSKLGPPPRIEVLDVEEDRGRYRVAGKGQISPYVLFGCECFWRLAEHALPGSRVSE